MSANVHFSIADQVGWVTLSNPTRFNAMTLAMWSQLAQGFRTFQQDGALRCVVVQGGGDPRGSESAVHFCAGGDISEYPSFRFEEDSLRRFHEELVWGALQAVIDCDIPVVAMIDGNCMGAGVEIASCCDIRIASDRSCFGAPIGRLGFPMAPREAALVMRAVGELTAREMLLSASVLEAKVMRQRGFLNDVVVQGELAQRVRVVVERVVSLAPQANRANKELFRAISPVFTESNATKLIANAYRYANTAEHREGVMAFLEKRSPSFAQNPQ